MCHHPRYDFNDAILPVGVGYWTALAETELAVQGARAAAS
jgi:hippurate hydrolase